MSTKVKIGITHSARDIEIEVEDSEAFMLDFEAMMSGSQKLWWVTDQQGNRYGLVVERIAYIEVGPERDRTVGFG